MSKQDAQDLQQKFGSFGLQFSKPRAWDWSLVQVLVISWTTLAEFSHTSLRSLVLPIADITEHLFCLFLCCLPRLFTYSDRLLPVFDPACLVYLLCYLSAACLDPLPPLSLWFCLFYIVPDAVIWTAPVLFVVSFNSCIWIQTPLTPRYNVGAVWLFFLKVFWPRDSTIFCNSPAVYVDWKFLIIALMMEMGIFTDLALFLKPLH